MRSKSSVNHRIYRTAEVRDLAVLVTMHRHGEDEWWSAERLMEYSGVSGVTEDQLRKMEGHGLVVAKRFIYRVKRPVHAKITPRGIYEVTGRFG